MIFILKQFCKWLFSDYCCDGHLYSTSEERRNCIASLDQFITYLENKFWKEE